MRATRRRSGETPPAQTAALAPASTLINRLGAAGTGASGWQRKIIEADREGPGVVGFYLDTMELLASLCPLVPEVQGDDGVWARSDDPVLNTLLTGYRSPLMPQADLVGRHVRHREGTGEAWVIDSEHLGYIVVTVPNVTLQGETVRWRDPFGRTRLTPSSRVWKSWVQDPYEPWKPHSPLRRALPNIERLRSAVRSQTRGADSRLITNGLLAFADDGSGTRPLSESAIQGQAGVDAVVDDYMTLAKLAFSSDDHPAAHVPFPMIGPAPQYVDLGRDVDTGALQMEDKAVEGFARDVNFPAQLLVAGPGSANHWNEWLLEEAQRRSGLAPKLQRVADDITLFFFRPMVAQAGGQIGQWVPPAPLQRIRVGFDMSFLTSKPDVTAQVMSAWTNGVIDRRAVAEKLGLGEVMEIPEGLDEYEHWQISTGKPGASYLEVEDGKLVEPPDVFGDAGSAEATPALPPAPPAGSEPAPDEFLGAENDAPPVPPPMLAALPQPPAPVAETLDRLVRADVALYSALSAQAQACVDYAVDTVAREVIKAHTRHSEHRAALRGLPAIEVWVNADPEVQQTFPLDAVVTEAIESCGSDDAFNAAAAAAIAALLILGVTPDGHDPTAGSVVLRSGLVAFITAAVRRGAGTLHVPPAVVRSAMAAAGSGRVSADGTLQRSVVGDTVGPEGHPVPGGYALGPAYTGPITSLGVRLRWQWDHAHYRVPVEPFAPHVALHGAQFDTPAGIPGGFHPGDHPHCTCALIPVMDLEVRQ